MPTAQQDKEFAQEMSESVDETTVKMGLSTLDNAIEWIGKRLSPGDVFSEEDLQSWAEANGYIKE